MIKYLPHKKIDKQKWDDCISQSPQAIIYALSWYLDVVSPGWAALLETENEIYKAAMPLPLKKKWGIHYLLQSRHTHELGIFSADLYTGQTCFLPFFQKMHKKICYAASYSFNTGNTYFDIKNQLKLPEIKNGIALASVTYHLNLNLPYTQLFNNFSNNQKRNIKKAAANNLTIQEASELDSLIGIFKANTENKFSNTFKSTDYNILKQLYETGKSRNLAKVYHVYHEGKLCSAGLFFFFKNKITYQTGTSTEKGRELNAMSFLLHAIIQQYAGSDKVLDFEGSPVPTLARFYSSFGAQKAIFYTITYNRYKPVTKLLRPFLKLKA